MAIIKKPYELSVWSEELKGEGQKAESRKFIIGAHDMTYLGRASALKLKTKINGTHELTFQIPTEYFDSEIGKYVHNKFIDEVFAERKIKLFYKKKRLEFFVKTVKEDKKHKGILKTFTCQDAFIDELSRNGYGLTFDEELYNNVEEIGTFTEEILEDSIWYYEPKNNWGDFTEYIEDKLYKISVDQFSNLKCYKMDFSTNSSTKITNIFTGEERALEMGDDQARKEGIFWDQKSGTTPLKKTELSLPENDGYIYIPYSCLDFCYTPTFTLTAFDIAATEEPYSFDNDSYALTPPSVNPNYLIQFYAVPAGEKIEMDEAGLILDKDHIYFMTLDQWNQSVNSGKWYIFEEKMIVNIGGINYSRLDKKVLTNPTDKQKAMGNKIVRYDGYLTEWNNSNIVKGKKIQISDRTEINISEEIDQYTTVYKNLASDYSDLYISDDWEFNSTSDKDYRVCSKMATRQIVPQLARNFVQNGVNINSADGWDVMNLEGSGGLDSAKIQYKVLYDKEKTNSVGESIVDSGMIYFTPISYKLPTKWTVEINNVDYKYYQKGDLFYTLSTDISGDKRTYTLAEDINLSIIRKNKGTKGGEEILYPGENVQTITYVNPGALGETIQITIPAIGNLGIYSSFINFGAVAQEKTLEKGKIYCLGLAAKYEGGEFNIRIGEGSLRTSNEYQLNSSKTLTFPSNCFTWNQVKVPWDSIDKDNVKLKTDNVVFTQSYILFSPKITIKNPYIVISSSKRCLIRDLELFEAYTKGIDQFSNAQYKYSGRNLINPTWVHENSKYYYSGKYTKEQLSQMILFEEDIMPGDTYEYQQYYIQRLFVNNKGYDTMGAKEFIASENIGNNKLPLDAAKYSEEDYEIQTNYINLDFCEKYNQTVGVNEKDCSHSDNKTGVCMYQLYGYCPYRFQTEKHCRKIRTLKGEKSNRFNLTQELSKVFECYPIYHTEHDSIGRIKTNDDGIPDKRIFFIKEKGNNSLTGFRYHKNLSDISRTIKSDKIVTKLYVQDVDSDISRTGLCSIKTAEDNPSKDSFILDLSYYIAKGMLDKDSVEQDLYGTKKNSNSKINGYLKTLGFYNTQYDNLSNKIINLTNSSYTELEANVNVNLDGIETAIKQLRKYALTLEKYKSNKTLSENNKKSSNAYNNYLVKYSEQEQILNQLILDTFYTNGVIDNNVSSEDSERPTEWINNFDFASDIRENWLNKHTYMKGMLGQFNREFLQIQAWKKERASYLKKINEISSAFFKKYEPYLKEGTWTDSNYLTDNAYYHGALEVAAEGAIPNVEYNIKVIGISKLPGYEDYEIDVADTSFIEDEEIFGIDKKSGLPNKFKILISELNENLDEPSKDSITVQNFTTQFEDLFKQVTASVQSLQFNQNIYKRSSNFTSLQNVEESSLQGTLDNNNLTLLSTSENNIQLDAGGQKGSDINNHANQYQLDGQGLQFSNNGGQSWNVGVGPSGINADYIKVGTLDASKVRIVDGNYVYFMWDRNGIAAYRDPQNATTTDSNINDYALFNKFGLSVVKNGNVKLRAGYAYSGASGKASDEEDCGQDIGFYLYDNSGNVIFETSEDGEGATINLAGQMKAYSGKTKVYINNTNFTNRTSNLNRVFSISSGDRNLFTVTENGTAYFGGTIKDHGGTSFSGKDEVDITNAGITITENSLTIDFNGLNDDGNTLQHILDTINDRLNTTWTFPDTWTSSTGGDYPYPHGNTVEEDIIYLKRAIAHLAYNLNNKKFYVDN